MSGICGILRLDDTPPDGIESMTACLEIRGPEGTQHFQDGPCAFGHTLLATTPEALHETLPLIHSETGCAITADIRLDNRDELMPVLGLADVGRVIGDGEIVLHAYLRWGEECPQHLLGDFAFAIWDPRIQKIFAARDHMGMKQLIYSHVEGKVWAFASEPTAVLRAADIPQQINEGRIADFLEGYLEGVDYTETFFDDIYRLPPAHCLTVDENGVMLYRYWTLTPGPELDLPSDAAYEKAFREVFTLAVGCRLRCNGPVGSMLSGGIDSGSVVAIATGLLADKGAGPLHTFSAVGSDAETCIETRTIQTAQTLPGLQPNVVDHTRLDPWADELIRLTKESAEPFDAHMVLPRSMYLAAQRAGMRVVLDGVAGDIVLTDGSQLARLIRRCRLRQAWREARGLEQFYGVGRGTRMMITGMREAILPNWLRQLRIKWRARKDHLPKGGLLHPDLALHINLAKRVAQNRRHSTVGMLDQATQRARTITGTPLVVGRERYDRVAAACGIEPRDPFMDIRLVQFCLSLPQRQVMRDGWRKAILRRAMRGIIPEEVSWRKGKEHLGGDFIKAIFAHDRIESELKEASRVNFSGILRRQPSGKAGQPMLSVLSKYEDFQILALALWLHKIGRHEDAEPDLKGY